MSILIKNIEIYNGKDNFIADIYAEDEIIKNIGQNLQVKAEKLIDGTGKILLPGGIDVHTHFNLDLGEFVAVDDWKSGPVAAAFGGTTTVVDHIGFLERGSSLQSMVDHYHEISKDKPIIDFSFHGVMQETEDSMIDEIQTLYDEGIVSLKLYTTYGGKVEDDQILKVLQKAKETGTVVCVHCENDGSIKVLREESEKEGHFEPIYHAKTRPNVTEAEAINRLAYLSKIAGDPKLYIVHTSTSEGLEEIKKARKNGLKNIYCETCTQYLTLTEDKYLDEVEGLKYIMAPPLRKEKDVEALWKGIIDGDVDVIATDHCPFMFKEHKLKYKDDFKKVPGGAPGVEERMEIILTEGTKRGVSINRLLDLLVHNPAKIMGLYPKKGNLSIGSDADFVIYNKEQYTISENNRHSAVDYTGYEGFKSNFKVDTVIIRGKVVVEKGKQVAKEGYGKFVKRIFEKH
ncbi:dihydropyrimidinase [Miniphocaeibacter massiliensis]|uniref:dihydropyrimidinase n=1 Tax=Miniphocaeibacter massiliensis TaxID=2041841 RepID=UPI000C1BB1B3|nr:dihydropyrimidinase [Miniphocaeibacter massiliensis]